MAGMDPVSNLPNSIKGGGVADRGSIQEESGMEKAKLKGH
jgi:hypothetical protein